MYEGYERTLVCNNRRVADAWMDEYKQIYDLTINKVF